MIVIPLAEAKDGLSALVAEISNTHEHYTITRNGRPVVALLPVEDLDALEETIFWLDREVSRLRAGEAALDEGPGVSGEEMAELMRQRRSRENPAG